MPLKGVSSIRYKNWSGKGDRTTKSKNFIPDYNKLWDRSRRAALLQLQGYGASAQHMQPAQDAQGWENPGGDSRAAVALQ